MKLTRNFSVEEQREGGGTMTACVIVGMILAIALSGCANISPLITGDGKDGGGGVAITTQQGGWAAPVVVGGGIIYLGGKIVDALKDKSNTYTYNGNYTENTAGNDNTVDSQNESSGSHARRIKAEMCLKHRK
jgi:hypothetical protein